RLPGQVLNLTKGIDQPQAQEFEHTRAQRVKIPLWLGSAAIALLYSLIDSLGKGLVVCEAQRVSNGKLAGLFVHKEGLVQSSHRLRERVEAWSSKEFIGCLQVLVGVSRVVCAGIVQIVFHLSLEMFGGVGRQNA